VLRAARPTVVVGRIKQTTEAREGATVLREVEVVAPEDEVSYSDGDDPPSAVAAERGRMVARQRLGQTCLGRLLRREVR